MALLPSSGWKCQTKTVGRILVSNVWYEPISSKSILEADFEQSILRFSEHLFPGYWCLRFVAAVQSDYGTSRADMVLVDKEYRGWTIVEAELEHHSLSSHVEPQMRRLVNGFYGEDHAKAICAQSPDLDKDKISRLIRNTEPEFLVIVPKEVAEWRTTLSNLGVRLSVVEVYSDFKGQRIVSQSGDRPRTWDEGHVAYLQNDTAFLPRAFRLDPPNSFLDLNEVPLMFRGFLTTWRVVRVKKATYILPNGSLDLEENQKYTIYRTEQGTLFLEVDKK